MRVVAIGIHNKMDHTWNIVEHGQIGCADSADHRLLDSKYVASLERFGDLLKHTGNALSTVVILARWHTLTAQTFAWAGAHTSISASTPESFFKHTARNQ